MKKTILGLLSVVVLFSTLCMAEAKTFTKNAQTAEAIRLYKSGDYTQSYLAFSKIVGKDSSNALAAYYMGMSAAQLGKKDEAIENYQRAAALSPNGVLGSYAKRGIKCIETPERCYERVIPESELNQTEDDKFIKSRYGSGFSEKARSEYEKQKIQNMMREINRDNDIAPHKFRDYKDFSSQVPSNDEIVEAIRTLQRAGMTDIAAWQKNNTNYDMLNALFGNNNSTSNLSPQVIQSLLTTQMTASF